MNTHPALKTYFQSQIDMNLSKEVQLRHINEFVPSQKQILQARDKLKVSEELYWAKYYEYYEYPDRQFEWKNGYLEEKFVGNYKNICIAAWLDFVIKCFLYTNPIAKLIQLEFAFRMALSTGISIRKPDFALVLNENPIALNGDDRKYNGIFDLCIESISDSNKKAILRDAVDKKFEYSQSGVKEYYILDESGNEMAFYRLNSKCEYQNIEPVDGDIIKSEVLLGFQFRISDLYRQPSIKEMAEDEVYQNFVFPYYQQEKQRAENEKKRAENEKQRAEKAELKVKILEEKVSQLEKQIRK